MQSGSGNDQFMSEINVTPFVDVMLVLLIIFMVTAPMMVQGVDVDLPKAIKKRIDKEEIYESLPKIDCGVCGAPTCLTLAEDIVKGDAQLTDCIFNLPQEFADLSQELSEILEKSASFRSVPRGFSKAINKKEKKYREID